MFEVDTFLSSYASCVILLPLSIIISRVWGQQCALLYDLANLNNFNRLTILLNLSETSKRSIGTHQVIVQFLFGNNCIVISSHCCYSLTL